MQRQSPSQAINVEERNKVTDNLDEFLQQSSLVPIFLKIVCTYCQILTNVRKVCKRLKINYK
jgi:hypothetical protein